MSEPTEMVRCRDCMFWDRLEDAEECHDGLCRRHGPRPIVGDEGVPNIALWPTTVEVDFCREGRAKDESAVSDVDQDAIALFAAEVRLRNAKRTEATEDARVAIAEKLRELGWVIGLCPPKGKYPDLDAGTMYREYRQKMAAASRARADEDRDIGPIPDPVSALQTPEPGQEPSVNAEELADAREEISVIDFSDSQQLLEHAEEVLGTDHHAVQALRASIAAEHLQRAVAERSK